MKKIWDVNFLGNQNFLQTKNSEMKRKRQKRGSSRGISALSSKLKDFVKKKKKKNTVATPMRVRNKIDNFSLKGKK